MTAAEVPRLRRELVDWTATRGPAHYTEMIKIGRQPIRPPGPSLIVGTALAHDEIQRLTNADLWHFDQDICELLQVAHHTMPRFAPTPQDLPSRTGFVVFAAAIADRDPAEELHLADYIQQLAIDADAANTITSVPVQISAVSWGPLPYPDPAKAPAGGVWMSFYANTRLHNIKNPDLRRRALALVPPMMVDNEAVVPWVPADVDQEDWMLPTPGTLDTTHGWAAMVFAAFRLATQLNLAEQDMERTSRPERRRIQRAQLPERDVRVVHLRRSLGGEHDMGDGSGRAYRHRWIVRGHWRNQPWGPGRELRRPVYILPHVKGPDGAPLIGGERVTAVTTPNCRREPTCHE